MATFYDALGDAVQLGLSAAQKKLSEEQLRVMFEEQYGKVTFRKGSLIAAAKAAFAGARQSLTPIGDRVELQDMVDQHSARGDED